MISELSEITKASQLNSPSRDWTYSVQLNRWFLRPIGAWPLSLCSSSTEKFVSVILIVVSCFLIGFLLVPCALCTILEEGDLDTKIKMIGPLSFLMMAAGKHYILLSRSADISWCVHYMRMDWNGAKEREKDREIMTESAKFGRSLAGFCAVFMYSGGFFYTTVMPLCAKRTELIDNETVRSQAFPIYRGLLDPRSSPYFEIVQLLQCLAGYVIYSVTISACSLTAVFVMHASGQFRILMAKLEILVEEYEKENKNLGSIDTKIGDIVEHHLRILDFISRIEELLNGICFIEFVGCTLNICFLGYYMMTEWEKSETIASVTYCALLISFTFNIFILCYIGELLTEQCKEVGLTSYMINWYQLPGKRPLDLILVIAISNSSIKLTAGKLAELSLATFCGVIKSSLAYLSLLRTLTT